MKYYLFIIRLRRLFFFGDIEVCKSKVCRDGENHTKMLNELNEDIKKTQLKVLDE